MVSLQTLSSAGLDRVGSVCVCVCSPSMMFGTKTRLSLREPSAHSVEVSLKHTEQTQLEHIVLTLKSVTRINTLPISQAIPVFGIPQVGFIHARTVIGSLNLNLQQDKRNKSVSPSQNKGAEIS